MFLYGFSPSDNINSKKLLDHMIRRLIRTGIFLLTCILTITSLCQNAFGQSNTEMEILRMYYREKDLVVSTTRHPKSISYIAENIAIVTAKEIEAMNAHTVAEVLNRIPGLFVNFNQDFGAASLLSIQGSEDRHVLVLMDGVTWNFLNSGAAETNSIPVGIIDRIEIIKGPASSTWGSSLGGVINIITKQLQNTARPTGSIRASYGEKNSQDYRGEVTGRAGSLGYYLFAGRQDSDGLRDSRYFENNSLYSKLKISIFKNANMGFTMGYSEPRLKIGDFPSEDITSTGDSRTFFTTASLDVFLARDLSLNISFHHFKQKSTLENRALGLGLTGTTGERFLDAIYDEATTGVNGKLAWEKGKQTVVLGADFSRGKLDQTLFAGSLLQSIGVAETADTHPEMDTWAIYANDTIIIDRWSITPGIRYDHNSITGSFISPSLGATYQLDEDSIFRASVARGFTLPPLSWTSGGGLFLAPNPALEPEKIWSYQAGIESNAARYFWFKAMAFQHELEDAIVIDPFAAGPPTFNDLFINNGKVRRRGFELVAETVTFHNLSLLGGVTYVDLKPSDERGADEIHSYNIGIRYDDKKSLMVQLFGNHAWRNFDPVFEAYHDDFVWDLNFKKKMSTSKKTASEIFLTIHNIFNGAQYISEGSMNPRRWVEAGIRMKF